MKRILLIILFAGIGYISNAQGFNQAVGIRMGWSPGFEYRVFTDDANSYKLLLSTRDRGVQIHALKEFHQYDMFNFTDQLVFFYGGGLHVGYERWDESHYNNNMHWYETHSSLIAGLDGLVGVEYVFYEAPISIGFEAKPYFDIFGRKVFDLKLHDFAFTVKYLF